MNYVVITQPPVNCEWNYGHDYTVHDVIKYQLVEDYWMFTSENGSKAMFRKDVVVSITPESEYLEYLDDHDRKSGIAVMEEKKADEH